MTVDGYDMNVGAKVARRVVGDDVEHEERWLELPDVADGRRENWMVDRAKNALGTAKLASVYLEEERGRICRLRNIKSVLASGKFMGTGAGRSSALRHNGSDKRRHCPALGSSIRAGNGAYGKIRRPGERGQLLVAGQLNSKYPAEPFVTIARESLPAIAAERETPRKDVVRTKWRQRDRRAQRSAEDAPIASNPVPDNRNTEPKRGGMEDDCRRSDYGHSTTPVNAAPDICDTLWRNANGGCHVNGRPPPADTGRCAEHGVRAIGSGPSAIDLFDEPGLVPNEAIPLEAPDESRCSPSQNQDLPVPAARMATDADDGYGAKKFGHSTAPAVMKPPKVPNGAWSRSRDPRARRRERGRHVGREPQTLPKDRGAHGQMGTCSGRGNCSGVVQDQTTPRSDARSTRTKAGTRGHDSLNSKIGQLQGRGRAGDKTGTSSKGSRARRRWDTEPDVVTSSPSALPEKGYDTGAAPLEKRLASAQARLHKSKDLQALKSEHQEALSILQDISCPSTAAAGDEDSNGDNDAAKGVDENVASSKADQQGHERERGLRAVFASGARGVSSRADTEGKRHGEADADELSANLPRIGSREQAALRNLYRKWWMEVARGGSVADLPAPLNGNILDANVDRPREESNSIGEREGPQRVDEDAAVKHVRGAVDPPTDSRAGAMVFQPDAVDIRDSSDAPTNAKISNNYRGNSACDNDYAPAAAQTCMPPCATEIDCCEPPPTAGAPVDTPHSAEPSRASTAKSRSSGAPVALEPRASPDDARRLSDAVSDVESTADADRLEQEEGHNGRIYLADGRFMATLRDNAGEQHEAGVPEEGSVSDGDGDVVPDESKASLAEPDEDYEDDDFES